MTHTNKVLTLKQPSQINQHLIGALHTGALHAIRIPNYCSEFQCATVTAAIELLYDGQTYSGSAANVGTFGLSLYEVSKNPDRIHDYYRLALCEQELLRQYCNGVTLPIDQIRIDLDEAWQHGLKIERFHDHRAPANCGLNRIVLPGGFLGLHVDRTDWDLPDNDRAQAMCTQFGANVYLETAQQGGELELWQFMPATQAEHDALMMPGSDYQLDRKLIGEPDTVITPQRGELIIFNARRGQYDV